MDGRYYYTPDPYIAPSYVWGIPTEYFTWFVLFCFAIIFVGACVWSIYGEQIVEYWRDRPSRKRIKSFVIKIKGTDMTEHKFQLATDDVNKILAGEKLFGVAGIGKKLNAKNIIGITNVTGEDCRYFVIWYKEGI